MYLLVFITLVISLIGIYTQVLTLQAARLAGGQTVIADQMLRWHKTAVMQVQTTQISPVPGNNGCDLTVPGIVGTPCNNPAKSNVTVSAPLPGGWTQCPGAGPPCWNPLPFGYQTSSSVPAGPYTFYSVYFTVGGAQRYVVTFVPPPTLNNANPTGFILLPGGAGNSKQIGISLGDLSNQIKNTGVNLMYYGTVAGGVLTTPAVSNGATSASFQYAMPASVPPGSVGIISTP